MNNCVLVFLSALVLMGACYVLNIDDLIMIIVCSIINPNNSQSCYHSYKLVSIQQELRELGERVPS